LQDGDGGHQLKGIPIKVHPRKLLASRGGYLQPIISLPHRRGHTHCSHVNESIGCNRDLSLKTSKGMEPHSLTKMGQTTGLLTSLYMKLSVINRLEQLDFIL